MLSRIEYIIDSLGITQVDFAKQIGMSPSTLTHIFKGRNKPSLDLLLKILNTFPFINTEWLLFGRGEMQKQQHKDVIEPQAKEVVRVEYKEEPKPIDHITVYYKDDTYCNFYPK